MILSLLRVDLYTRCNLVIQYYIRTTQSLFRTQTDLPTQVSNYHNQVRPQHINIAYQSYRFPISKEIFYNGNTSAIHTKP